jgi:hypothetical protein
MMVSFLWSAQIALVTYTSPSMLGLLVRAS